MGLWETQLACVTLGHLSGRDSHPDVLRHLPPHHQSHCSSLRSALARTPSTLWTTYLLALCSAGACCCIVAPWTVPLSLLRGWHFSIVPHLEVHISRSSLHNLVPRCDAGDHYYQGSGTAHHDPAERTLPKLVPSTAKSTTTIISDLEIESDTTLMIHRESRGQQIGRQ